MRSLLLQTSFIAVICQWLVVSGQLFLLLAIDPGQRRLFLATPEEVGFLPLWGEMSLKELLPKSPEQG